MAVETSVLVTVGAVVASQLPVGVVAVAGVVEARTQVESADAAAQLLVEVGHLRGRAAGTGCAYPGVIAAGHGVVCAGDRYVGHKHVVGQVGHPVGCLCRGGLNELRTVPVHVPRLVGWIVVEIGAAGLSRKGRACNHCP